MLSTTIIKTPGVQMSKVHTNVESMPLFWRDRVALPISTYVCLHHTYDISTYNHNEHKHKHAHRHSNLLVNLYLDYVHYDCIASLFNCDLLFRLTVHILFQNVANIS